MSQCLKFVKISWFCISIAKLCAFSRNFPDQSAKTTGTFFEHVNCVLNVAPVLSVSTYDPMACALECLKRNFCFSFNFAVYPGNNNCKLLREDKHSSPARFEPSRYYHHYSIMSPCEYSPCEDGATCRPLYGTNGFLCETVHGRIGKAASWIKLNKDVCFGAKNDSYGNFTIQHGGAIIALKLVYVSGYVTCNTRETPHGSHWACNRQFKLGTIVTDADNRVVFPHDYNNKSYSLPGYHINSSELVYQPLISSLTVKAGDEYRIWYHEDFQDSMESDNAGHTCTDVYVIYN